MKYVVFTLLVLTAAICGWFSLQNESTLFIIVNNETSQSIQFDIVGDGCKEECLNNANKPEVLASQARYENSIDLKANGELRFMLRHSSLGLNHLLIDNVATLSAKKLFITIKDKRQIDVRFEK